MTAQDAERYCKERIRTLNSLIKTYRKWPEEKFIFTSRLMEVTDILKELKKEGAKPVKLTGIGFSGAWRDMSPKEQEEWLKMMGEEIEKHPIKSIRKKQG